MSERNPARFNTIPNAQNRSPEEQARLLQEVEDAEMARYEASFSEDDYNESMQARKLEAAADEMNALADTESRIMENVKARRLYTISQEIAGLRTNGGEPEVIADKEARLEELLVQYFADAEADRNAALRAAESERDTVKGNRIRAAKEAEAEVEMVKRMEEADFLINSTDPAWVSEKLNDKKEKSETEKPASDHDPLNDEPDNDVDTRTATSPTDAEIAEAKGIDNLFNKSKREADGFDTRTATEATDDERAEAEATNDRIGDDQGQDRDDEYPPRHWVTDPVGFTGEQDPQPMAGGLTPTSAPEVPDDLIGSREHHNPRHRARGVLRGMFEKTRERFESPRARKKVLILGGVALAVFLGTKYGGNLLDQLNGHHHVVGEAVATGGPKGGPSFEAFEYPATEGSSANFDVAFSPDALQVTPGEGWFKTFRELGMDSETQKAVLGNDKIMGELQSMGLAYTPELGGWGMNMPSNGKMPPEALKLIIQAREAIR